MATVYLGHDRREDGVEELVALKVIRDELANDETFSAMFIDEAKILARLSHPNVIQTLEYGISGTHRFIAMELLNGRTVADLWDTLEPKKERFELGSAAWICARVAEGLHSAHELVDEEGSPLNVIHRDVNPSNIFLTYHGEVKLIDFGLARARVRVSKSAEGIIKGKIPYLAPEQARGKQIDRRTDVYALGTTLWEMSTMKRLFKRDTDIDTLKAIRDAKVPDPREENPDFPEALWKIIERSLRIDADERYASAEEMRADLDAFARATGPHAAKVAALVGHLFPGGEERMQAWLENASSVVPMERTMVPPAPVPTASSSLLETATPAATPRRAPPLLPSEIEKLEEVEAIEAPPSLRDVPGPAAPPPSAAPPPTAAPSPSAAAPPSAAPPSSATPSSERGGAVSLAPGSKAGAESLAPTSKAGGARKKKPKANKKAPRAPKRKKKRGAGPEAPAPVATPRPAPPAPAEDGKKLVLWVGIAVAILLVLAVLATR